MIIEQEQRLLKTSGVQQQNSFKIAATAHMQSILSDKMYSDKIMAVLREVTCNATDAHHKVGKGTEPIHVNLPTQLSPELQIKDYGPGLSHDAVMELYTTYGLSDKSGSNELIGGLGLGSKSPFAYTDQFVIESRFNGVISTYSCFKNEDGEMQIGLLKTDQTMEGNGLTIKVPVKHGDTASFIQKAATLFQHYRLRPETNVPLQYTDHEVVLQGKGWKLLKEAKRSYNSFGSHNSTSKARMGDVVYPIMSKHFEDSLIDDGMKGLFNSNLLIDFSIGELGVAANREELSYNKVTQSNIISKFQEIVGKITQQTQKDISSESSMFNALLKLTEVTESMDFGGDIIRAIKTGTKYKGVQVGEFYKNILGSNKYYGGGKLSTSQLKGITLKTCQNPGEAWAKFYEDREIYGNNLKNYEWIYVDEKVAWQKRALENVIDPGNKSIITVHGTQGDFDEMLKVLGYPDYRKTSDLPKYQITQSSTGQSRSKVMLKEYKGFFDQTDVDHDLEDGGVSIKTLKGSPVDGSINHYSDLFREIEQLDKNPLTVFCVPGTYHKALEKNSAVWVSIEDYHAQLKAQRTKESRCLKKQFLQYKVLRSTFEAYEYDAIKKLLTWCMGTSIISTKKSFIDSFKHYSSYIKLKEALKEHLSILEITYKDIEPTTNQMLETQLVELGKEVSLIMSVMKLTRDLTPYEAQVKLLLK